MGQIYIQYEYWFAAIQLFFAMLGMGATLTFNDFKDVAREPKSVGIGVVLQLVIIPLLAFGFIYFTDVSAGVAIGIALLAAIPGGTTSNIFTYLAKGNVPLSISITGLTTLACLITTPLILGLLITEYLPDNFSMPADQIIRDITFILLLPLIIGMLILRYISNHASWISAWSIRLSLVGIILIVVGSASAGRLDINAYGTHNMLLVSIFIITLLCFTWLMLKLLGLSNNDSTAIEMEVIVRNVNLGVMIKASMFPVIVGNANTIGDMVLFTVLLYGALQIIISAIVIMLKRRGGKVSS
jgi:BASS family bile acid:Na+ symporter